VARYAAPVLGLLAGASRSAVEPWSAIDVPKKMPAAAPGVGQAQACWDHVNPDLRNTYAAPVSELRRPGARILLGAQRALGADQEPCASFSLCEDRAMFPSGIAAPWIVAVSAILNLGSFSAMLYLLVPAAWTLVAALGLAICRSAARIEDSESLCLEERVLARHLLEQEQRIRSAVAGTALPARRRGASS
jgi:hypothetical protein